MELSELRLTVELVPRPSWGCDLAKLAPRHMFDRYFGAPGVFHRPQGAGPLGMI